jgi:hypothetical protein
MSWAPSPSPPVASSRALSRAAWSGCRPAGPPGTGGRRPRPPPAGPPPPSSPPAPCATDRPVRSAPRGAPSPAPARPARETPLPAPPPAVPPERREAATGRVGDSREPSSRPDGRSPRDDQAANQHEHPTRRSRQARHLRAGLARAWSAAAAPPPGRRCPRGCGRGWWRGGRSGRAVRSRRVPASGRTTWSGSGGRSRLPQRRARSDVRRRSAGTSAGVLRGSAVRSGAPCWWRSWTRRPRSPGALGSQGSRVSGFAWRQRANFSIAAGVTGVKKLTRLPSGSRNSSDRLPQGIVVGSVTKPVTKPVRFW